MWYQILWNLVPRFYASVPSKGIFLHKMHLVHNHFVRCVLQGRPLEAPFPSFLENIILPFFSIMFAYETQLGQYLLCLLVFYSRKSYYDSSSVCLCVCSLCTPRSFDGSSPNLVGVCRLTSHLPLRGSFSKRSKASRVNGSLSLSTILYMCQPHSTRCNGTFCLASSRV